MTVWTKEWPAKPGWYWSWREDDVNPEGKRNIKPVQVVTAGREPDTHIAYLRNGHFFYKAEQLKPVWWMPLDLPEGPTS